MLTLQQLSDLGINPFAVKLLVESFLHHQPKPGESIEFNYGGVHVKLEYVPPEKEPA